MRGTPRILRYRRANRVCKNAQVRTIRREGRSTRSEPSETARRAPAQGAPNDDTVHAPWRHGDHVNKVSVGEPADGSPPKEPSNQGGLGKVERASATRSRASNPLIFCWVRRLSRPRFCGQASTGSDNVFDVVSISEASGWALLNQGAWTWPISSRHSAGIGRPSWSRRNQSTTASTSVSFPWNVTRIAFRTFAAASAAMRFSNTAAYGFFDIHQMTRNIFLPAESGSPFRVIAVRVLRPLNGWAQVDEVAGRGKGRCQHVGLVLTNASQALGSATHDGHEGHTISVFQRERRGDALLNDIVHDDADRGFDFPSHRLQLPSRFGEPRGDCLQDTPQVRFLGRHRDVIRDPGGSPVRPHEPDGDNHNRPNTGFHKRVAPTGRESFSNEAPLSPPRGGTIEPKLRMLHVDLDRGEIESEERGPEYWERYIGGRGVRAEILGAGDFPLRP